MTNPSLAKSVSTHTTLSATVSNSSNPSPDAVDGGAKRPSAEVPIGAVSDMGDAPRDPVICAILPATKGAQRRRAGGRVALVVPVALAVAL